LASASVVKFIKEYLKEEPINDIKAAFEEAVLYANTQICMGVQGTTGMLIYTVFIDLLSGIQRKNLHHQYW
jgi:hypothetical protein